MRKIEKLFEKHDDEFLKFDRIEHKLSKRPDLHAFILLDGLLSGDDDMITSAEHDEIWLDVDLDELTKIITEEQIIDLIRCGVMLDEEHEGFSMFV